MAAPKPENHGSKSHQQPVTDELCRRGDLWSKAAAFIPLSPFTSRGPAQLGQTTSLQETGGSGAGKRRQVCPYWMGKPKKEWPVKNCVQISRRKRRPDGLGDGWCFNFQLTFRIQPVLLVLATCHQGLSFTFRLLLNNQVATPEDHCSLSSLLQSRNGNSGKYFQKTPAWW